MVRSRGLEPPHLSVHAPQACASANSATTAYQLRNYSKPAVLTSPLNYFFGAAGAGLGGCALAGAGALVV